MPNQIGWRYPSEQRSVLAKVSCVAVMVEIKRQNKGASCEFMQLLVDVDINLNKQKKSTSMN
jgi:hypothetical protein